VGTVYTFQNGGLANSEKHYTSERLVSKNRLHRCVFNSADAPVPPPLFAIHMEGGDLSVHLSNIWVIFRTANIYQTFKTRSGLFEEERNRGMIYLDYILIMNSDRDDLTRDVEIVKSTLEEAGLINKRSKSETEPTRSIEFLKLIVDTVHSTLDSRL
jgi:hypothetical protein